MTINLFQHTVAPVNSTTSPVENLAQETSKAFDGVQEFLKSDAPLPSYSSVIGNYLLLDINTHGVEKDCVETISVADNTSQVTTEQEIKNVISISYIDNKTNTVKYLDEKLPSQAFTDTLQFKVLGKVIYFSGPIPNETVKVSYRGIRKSFGNLNLKPNVLFNQKDKSYLLPLKGESNTLYSVEYDHNLEQQSKVLFNTYTPNKDNTYLLLKTLNGYQDLKYKDVYLESNKIYFNLESELTDDYEVIVFISNTTVGEFLEAFYTEYMKHSHSKEGLDNNIKHSDIVDLYSNTDKIFYKDTDIVNYQHPQFFNREGYNPNINSAYENALLGDLFLSSVISSSDQEYKTLLKNSNSILFGDPVKGTKLYFDTNKKAIVLLTGTGLNGLNIVVSNDNKAISINDDSYLQETEDSLKIKGKKGLIEFEDTVKSDKLVINYTAKIKAVEVEQLTIGNTTQSKDDSNNLVVKKINEELDTQFQILMPTQVKKITSDVFSTKSYLLRDGDKLSINDNNYLTKGVIGFDLITDALKIRSTKRGSGLHLGDNDNLSTKMYTANYLGEKATEQDSSFFIEAPQNNDIYFLKNTNDTYKLNNVEQSFGKGTGNVITSLKEWKGANIFLNTLNASNGVFKTNDCSTLFNL